MRELWWLSSATLILLVVYPVGSQFDAALPCFCKLGEAVESCNCGPESIDVFNKRMVFDRLQALLKRDFFKFYKVNMDKSCPFWPDDRQCSSSQCGIAFCDDEVPAGLRKPAVVTTVRLNRTARRLGGLDLTLSVLQADAEKLGKHNHTTREAQNETSRVQDPVKCATKDESNAFDPMDRSLGETEKKQLDKMDSHYDDQSDRFCEVDDEDSTAMHYVDLSKNPERYTGYKGDSAVRVWKSIYSENCFKPDMKFDKNFLTNPNNFAPGGFGGGSWFRNTKMFADRFGTKWSWEGPQRLRNVYFVYLLELRALMKVAPYLQKELFFTGNEKEDEETRAAIDDLLVVVNEFKDHFDESEMFTGVEAHARSLREEFRSHFLNISRIMDCVGCDKCRLWGKGVHSFRFASARPGMNFKIVQSTVENPQATEKVQVHGMGTALKILFSDLPYTLYNHRSTEGSVVPAFQLTRNEVVALLQSFGRYSSSIWEVSEFRSEMVPGHTEL